MKKYILLLSLGLGLLTTQESFAADPAMKPIKPLPCNPDGFCYIRNATPWDIFLFDSNKKFLGSIVGTSQGTSPNKSLAIQPTSFPISVSFSQDPNDTKWKLTKIADTPHCYAIWHFSDFYTTRWECKRK